MKIQLRPLRRLRSLTLSAISCTLFPSARVIGARSLCDFLQVKVRLSTQPTLLRSRVGGELGHFSKNSKTNFAVSSGFSTWALWPALGMIRNSPLLGISFA
jgi:hypothetical protein